MESNPKKKCCVAGCKSSWPSGENISFHSFPPKLELTAVQLLNEQGNHEAVSRHEAWRRILQLKQLRTSESRLVCSRHFKADEFEVLDKKTLKQSAIPTLNLPPVSVERSLRIRSDKDLLMPKLKDPLALSPTKTSKPIVLLNEARKLPNLLNVVKFGPSKSPIARVNLKRAGDNSANLTPTQPAKKPRVAAIKDRNPKPAPPQVFFVGLQGGSDPSTLNQPVNKPETVQPNPITDKTPAKPILFLKQVPKPVGVKLTPAKNVKIKAVISEVKRNVNVGQAKLNGQQLTPLKNAGEQTVSSSKNTPQLGNSVTVKTPKTQPIILTDQLLKSCKAKVNALIASAQRNIIVAPPIDLTTQPKNVVEKPKAPPSIPVEQLGSMAGKKLKVAKRPIRLNSAQAIPKAATSKKQRQPLVVSDAAGEKGYHPVPEYCAFVNCATTINGAKYKVVFPTEASMLSIWMQKAGIRIRPAENVLKKLFACEKHFRRSDISSKALLNPFSCPDAYQRYSDRLAVDANPHWVQKKMETNCSSIVDDNCDTTESSPELERCCIKNCPAKSDTTVLYQFPPIVLAISNLKLAYQIQKRYHNKKICINHSTHPFFKNLIFNASAAVLLDLQILWIEISAERAKNISDPAAEEIVENSREDAEHEDFLKTKVYVPMTEYCAFINCATHTSAALKQFKFPEIEPMRQSWSVRAGIPRSFPAEGLKLLFVCDKHFTEHQFLHNGDLSPMAVPASCHSYEDPAVKINENHWRRKKSLTNCDPKKVKCCIENCPEKPTSAFSPLGAMGYLIKLDKLTRNNLEDYKKRKVCDKHRHEKFCDDAELVKSSILLNMHSTQEVLDQITNEALSGGSGDASGDTPVINLCDEELMVNARASPPTVYKPTRQYCAIINCTTHLKRAARKFLFPTDKNLLNSWRTKAGIPSCVADEDLKMLFVCSNHFNKAQFSKWGTLLAGSVPEDYKLYKNLLASDLDPHWLRKKRLTNCDANVQVVEKCVIKDCIYTSENTHLCLFPSLNGFVKYGSLSKNVINYYENKKICRKHLEHDFFKQRLLNYEAMQLLDLVAVSANSKPWVHVVWRQVPESKFVNPRIDFYGDIKGKAILRKDCIVFPYIQRELYYSPDPPETNTFRYNVKPFTKTANNEKPTPGKKVQMHTALIIDNDCEAATIERIRQAFTENGNLDFLKKTR